ncbi:MAG: lytic transglycosylase domain-containing protein [Bryobacteraceae bacterium]
MRALILSFSLVYPVFGNTADEIRAAMQASLDQQKISVRRQVETAKVVPPGTFFTIPWPDSDAMVTPAAWDASCDAMPEPALASLIDEAAKREDLKPGLLRAVVQKESAARPCAVSVKGAQGLMQIMPATAADLNLSDPFDPKQNIDAGAKLLKQLLTKYSGDLALALGAYNAGSGRVDKAGGVPQNSETQDYVSDILKKIKE